MFPIGQSGKGFGNEQEGLVTIPQMATASSSNLPFGNFFESFWTPLVRFNMESEFDTTLRTHLRPQLNIFLKASKTLIRPICMFWGIPKKQRIYHEIQKWQFFTGNFQEFSRIWRVFYKSYGSQSLCTSIQEFLDSDRTVNSLEFPSPKISRAVVLIFLLEYEDKIP